MIEPRPVAYHSIESNDSKVLEQIKRYKQVSIGTAKRNDFFVKTDSLDMPGPADYDPIAKSAF